MADAKLLFPTVAITAALIAPLASAAHTTAVQTSPSIAPEIAFNTDARERGQWTAFRASAAADAIMFTPKPERAQEFLRDRADPPVSVQWSPSESFVACDQSFAVNTGPWIRSAGGTVGYFTTVWRRQNDQTWKWTVDFGDALVAPLRAPRNPISHFGSCHGSPPATLDIPQTANEGGGHSPDRTLTWRWKSEFNGAATFKVWLWNGKRMSLVISKAIAA